MKSRGNVQTEIAALESRWQSRLAARDAKTQSNDAKLEFVRVRDAAYSRLFFFRGLTSEANSSFPLVIKVFKGSDKFELARQQYNTLKLLSAEFYNTGHLMIPRALDFFDDLPAIVMEEIKGQSVQDLIRQSVWQIWSREKASNACRRCGEWLRQFHKVTRVADGQLDVIAKQENLRLGLDQLVKYGFAYEIIKCLEAKAQPLAGILAEQCDRRALVHGDFSVDNVLVNGEVTTALDIEGRHQNLIYHDVASFLNSIALMSLALPVPVAFQRKCSEAFLNGYGEEAKGNLPALWFLRVLGLVSVAIEVLGRYQPQPLVQLWLRQSFTRLFKGLSAEAPA